MYEQQCVTDIDVGYIQECKYGIGKMRSAISNLIYSFTRDSFIKPKNPKLIYRELHYQSFPDVKSIYVFNHANKNIIINSLEIKYWPYYTEDYEDSKLQQIQTLLLSLKEDMRNNRQKYKLIIDNDLVKLIPDAWFKKELGPKQFYQWYDEHREESHMEKILDVFAQWYADQLIANDFKNMEWEKLLKHITGEPHYHPRGVAPYSLFEGYDKWHYYDIGNDFSYNSDRYPTYQYLYAYDLYETLVKTIDYRHQFTKEKVEETISMAKSDLQFCHFENDEGRTKAYYKGSLKNVLRAERTLMLEHVDNITLLKEQYTNHQLNNVEYCKKAILLWKEFIEVYERCVSELLTAPSQDDAAYLLRKDPEA